MIVTVTGLLGPVTALMTANDLLSALTQALFVLVFLVVIVQAVRQPQRRVRPAERTTHGQGHRLGGG